jgi:hypothetical protein
MQNTGLHTAARGPHPDFTHKKLQLLQGKRKKNTKKRLNKKIPKKKLTKGRSKKENMKSEESKKGKKIRKRNKKTSKENYNGKGRMKKIETRKITQKI